VLLARDPATDTFTANDYGPANDSDSISVPPARSSFPVRI